MGWVKMPHKAVYFGPLYYTILYCTVLYCIVLEGLEEDEEITADTYIHTHNFDPLSQPVPSGYGLRENIAILLVEVSECLREYFYLRYGDMSHSTERVKFL